MLTTLQPLHSSPTAYNYNYNCNYNNYNNNTGATTLIHNNNMTKSSLLQYSLLPQPQQVQQQAYYQQQQQQQQHLRPTSPLRSPSPTVVPNSNHLPTHSAVVLPSIHSLNIPTFPHCEEEVHVNRSSNIRSPPLLIPKSDITIESNRASSTCYSYSSDSLSVPPVPLSSQVPSASSSCSSSTYNYTHTPLASPFPPAPLATMTASSKSQQQEQPPTVLLHLRSPSASDHEEYTTDHDGSSSSPTQSKKNWKPRKKRQCPECKLYFSNLATHKSTHLKPTNRPHICEYCQRGFARPNDLFRHTKCHWKEIGSDKGQFKCPFKTISSSTITDSNDGDDLRFSSAVASSHDSCCHSTGIFSRCDTFKNHLKAIHFQYPHGTKKDQRNKVAGKCRMCLKEFENVDDWIHNHIETDSCPYAVNKTKRD